MYDYDHIPAKKGFALLKQIVEFSWTICFKKIIKRGKYKPQTGFLSPFFSL